MKLSQNQSINERVFATNTNRSFSLNVDSGVGLRLTTTKGILASSHTCIEIIYIAHVKY